MLLITTTHHLLGYSEDTGFRQVHSGNGLYYGLALHEDKVFVSCRNNTAGPLDSSARSREYGSILVFDKTTLQVIEELQPPDFPLRDVHGIAVADSRIWVTCSCDNLVAIYDMTSGQWERWFPSPDPAARGIDINHFNTISFEATNDGSYILLLAHNNGPSQIFRYQHSSRELESVIPLGVHAHDIFTVAGARATCSSGEGLLLSADGWRYRTGAFPRGIAFTDDSVWIGVSHRAARAERASASGCLLRLTREWLYSTSHILPNVGMVLATAAVELDRNVLQGLEPFHAVEDPHNPERRTYAVGESRFDPVLVPEWHSGEQTHRWSACLNARLGIVVNAAESTLLIDLVSLFPGSIEVTILFNGVFACAHTWNNPGPASLRLSIPAGAYGACTLTFCVPHLWSAAEESGGVDPRRLGICVQKVEVA